MMKPLLTALSFLLAAAVHAAPSAAPSPAPPANGAIKVAFVLSENANLMDIAGPWEVFQDTMLDDGKDTMPYALYTVAPSTAAIHTTGSGRPGLAVTPDYAFADAPLPDIVIVGAQSGGPALRDWLKRLHAEHKMVVSICTGAFELARAGLLDGKPATTHHWYFGNMTRDFPDVRLVHDVRWMQADPTTWTAGGLTSGVDLALHLVAERFGEAQAERTANFMEYLGQGWKSNAGIAALSVPVKRQSWTGTMPSGTQVVLHVLTTGASDSFTMDIPAQHVSGAPATVQSADGVVHFALALPGHTTTFDGRGTPDGTEVQGTFTQDGVAAPLTLRQMKP